MQYKGLTTNEAKKLLEQYGENTLKEQKKRTLKDILIEQVKWDFMTYFMIWAVILSFFVWDKTTAFSILWVILIIVTVGIFQEYKAEKAVDALKNMLESFSTVIRDQKEIQINSKELVPGDIVLLETGAKIPADSVILESKDLMVVEAVLTWESREIEKEALAKINSPHTEKNLIYMWTHIVNGRAIVKVLNTWANSEFGKIASMISDAEKELPLKQKVNKLVKFMAMIAIFVSLWTALFMFYNIESWTWANVVEVILVSIALMVAAFPEWMPVVLISTLAWWTYKMAKKKAIVNRMSIIETLGEATVICSDKTWTITKWEMTVKELFTYSSNLNIEWIGYEQKWDFLESWKKIDPRKNPEVYNLLRSAILCNNVHIVQNHWETDFKGTPTEIALMVLWQKAWMIGEISKHKRIDESTFNSQKKMMSVLVQSKWENLLFSKWASEFFIPNCSHIQKWDQIIKLSQKEKDKIQQKIDNLSSKKYRVLCLWYKQEKKNQNWIIEENIIFLWAVGLEDSPREWVFEAITKCHNAGIDVKMITWDNVDTAIAIAKDVWIVGEAVSGEELDQMTDKELIKRVRKIAIFARVSPEHKLRIVRALKELDEVVVMTGDGVNDAPALKEAHVWVAMWINWTDVSREAADLVLEDDNFVTIVSAIEQWRTIFKNIQKFVIYELSCNLAELLTIFFAVLLWWPAPLIAIQILFMNLVTDNLPSLTLWFTEASKWIMQEKAKRNSEILDKNKKFLMFGLGLFMTIWALIVYYVTLKVWNWSLVQAHTATLLTLIMFELMNSFNFISLETSFFKTNFMRNKLLLLAVLWSLLASIAIIYIPFLQPIFGTSAMSLSTRLYISLITFSVIIFMDIIKYFTRKRAKLSS